jgi:tRNA A37 threonylcarbamoyladenosine modification protein TsaB
MSTSTQQNIDEAVKVNEAQKKKNEADIKADNDELARLQKEKSELNAGNDSNYAKIRETKAEIIDENSFQEETEILHLIGDGAMKFKEILTDEKFKYYPEIQFPSAAEMSLISFQKFQNNQFEDVAYFEPFYLKDFVLITKK